MSCDLRINKPEVTDVFTEVTDALKKSVGNNSTLFGTYFTFAIKDKTWQPAFKEYCKTTYNIDLDTATNLDVDTVVAYIKEAYNAFDPDTDYFSLIQNDSTSVGRFGYTSLDDRTFAIKTLSNFILDVYHQILHEKYSSVEKMIEVYNAILKAKNQPPVDITPKNYLANAAFSKIKKEIENRLLAKGFSQAKIRETFNKNDTIALESYFGKEPSIQDLNLLAIYKEVLANKQEVFAVAFRDDRVVKLNLKKDDTLNSDIEFAVIENQDEETDEDFDDETTNDNEASKNNTIGQLNNKDGLYQDVMTHVGMGVRSYLGSLKKLNSGNKIDGQYDFNTDNALGIPDCMDVHECCGILYNSGNFVNVSTMIQSIRDIANNIPGFAAFHQMADYLTKNQDFAYEVYTTFAKLIIGKQETIVDENGGKTRLSNRRSDKLTVLRFEYLNSVKATAVMIDDVNSNYIFEKLNNTINDYKQAIDLNAESEANSLLKEALSELSHQIRRYYPTIDEKVIANYVEKANKRPEDKQDNDRILRNLNTLTQLLKETINGAFITQQAFNSRQTDIIRAYAHNESLKTKKIEGFEVKPSDYKDMSELYSIEYTSTQTQQAAFQLANELVNYTKVTVELNSRNVHGNQSSDVMNNSMITNILNTLKSQTALENFGKYKGQSRQYDFSNIMVEHKDTKGNIINFGLFTQDPDSKELTPTRYAHRLLRARLFSGATDMITHSNILYSEMSKGDYVATAFINFFNTERDFNNANDEDHIDFADYFMRIPSDAPKTFILTMPRYSVRETGVGNNGLFIIENSIEANRKINTMVNNLTKLNKEYESSLVTVERSLNQVISNVTAKTIGDIVIPKQNYINEKNSVEGDTITVNFEYKDKNNISAEYVLKGILAKDDKGNLVLKNPEFVGFVGNELSNDVTRSLEKHYKKELIKSGEIKRKINTNHSIYQQFRNIFVQELTDAATALDVIFKTKDGLPILDNDGNPVFNEGFSNDPVGVRQLLATYHYGKSGKVIEKDGLRYKLTGKVFSSDRFIITKTDENGNVKEENYGQNILNEAFDFLYGGATAKGLKVTHNNKNITVELTDAQEAIVEKHLTKFINDYIADTTIRLEQYKEFMDEHLLSEDNIAEFALNHHITYISFNDLFEGDTKFYKDAQTFLKRAKESQGSGVPYGIVDYNTDLTAPRTIIESRLNSKSFVRTFADGRTETLDIKQFNRFRGVTIKNTIRTEDTIGVFEKDSKGNIIYKNKDGKAVKKNDVGAVAQMKVKGALTTKLIDALHASGLSKVEAENKAANMIAGYDSTTVNDAQSYITFDEWVRRVSARGQLEKYMPLIEAILDETKPLDAATIKEFIQVQKNFYYDQHYNARLKVVNPRQIKNAEFVLVPRLIKGTQLEDVYNLMKECGIDQLNTEETSKAGKSNVLTIWDNEGNITDKHIADFKANAPSAIELYNYNYLYTQQETPQHMGSENKAGIQVVKKIFDNIQPGHKLYKYKELFFELYSANIKESFDDLMSELEVELDKNGNLKLDDTTGQIKSANAKLFFDRLLEEAARLGLDSNIMDYLTLEEDSMFDTFGDGVLARTKMPTFMSNVSTKLESIAQSIFNSRITRQKLPGFHAAQITNVGWNASNSANIVYKLTENGKGRNLKDNLNEDEFEKIPIRNKIYYIKTKGNVGVSKDLKYHPDGKPYIEVLLPRSTFNIKYEKEDGSLMTIEDLQKAGLDMMIGYRIPTEGKQSVCVMKVVGFVDDALGSTIVVPDGWVSQTGSDFDIDSVYGITYTGKFDKTSGEFKKIEYNKDNNNTRIARNNKILDCMIEILSSEEAMEENLSRSNFDNIIDARDATIDENVAKRRNLRSPYNFLDQADYQEDVMSGAKLKAFSVTRDTFCSVCNTVRPIISETSAIRIVYFAKDGYTEKQLKDAFDKVQVIEDGENTKFIVTHNTFGWSNNNKNVIGELITPYSSQTTAHILDAVKEGAIPNVNDLTFQVYKTFPDIGSDYITGVSFMMQPGITRIVEAYNSNKSIYSKGYRNPVHAALYSIAKDLLALDNETLDENLNIDDLLKVLDSRYSENLNKLFNGTTKGFNIKLEDKEIAKLPIIGSLLKDRLKNKGIFDGSSPVEEMNKLLFDFGVILQYYKLSNLGNAVGNYARVCNPDKFGAKQTIFETNKVFDDIQELVSDEKPVLTSNNGKSFLLAIYPDVDKGLTGYIQSTNNNSVYPPLHYFLKYATATSIKINRSLFETQNPNFISAVMSLSEVFSGNNTKMDKKTYKEYQNYILNYLYGQVSAVANSVTYDLEKGFVYAGESNLEEERRRIYGYGKNPDLKVKNEKGELVNFSVTNINHPTQEEINQFSTLSPAQKVIWIQSNFNKTGVFKYISATLFNSAQYRKNKAGAQTIEFIEGNTDIETVYNEFNKCYYSSNPLIALATLDIIKYGFVVEGFRMKRNAVNKVIANKALMEDSSTNGTNIVQELRRLIAQIQEDDEQIQKLRHQFVRSHSTMKQISIRKVDKTKNNKFELPTYNGGLIYLDIARPEYKALAVKYDFITPSKDGTEDKVNMYVKLRFGNKLDLYKIEKFNNEIVVYPLNLLEENENSEFSVNTQNNLKHYTEEYYTNIISNLRNNTNASLQSVLDEAKKTQNDYRYKNTNAIKPDNLALSFDLNNPKDNEVGGFESVVKKINDTFSDLNNKRLYIRSHALSNYIKHEGAINGSVQTITDDNGVSRDYIIQKVSGSKYNKKYIGAKNANHDIKEKDPGLRQIIEDARNGGYSINDLFLVTPYVQRSATEENTTNDEIVDINLYQSSISEQFGVKSMQSMYRSQVSENDINAGKALKQLHDKDITAKTASVAMHLDETYPIIAEYVQTSVDKILNDLQYFIKDAEGHYHSVNEEETINLIRNNPNERDRFLKTLLEARAFVRNYKLINEFDVDSEDENIRKYIIKIKEAINKLQNAPIILNAEKRFATDYLAKLSDNPRIQKNIISLLDGYHSQSAFDAWVNDLQESSSPLIQIITKEVMADIRAKEALGHKLVLEFRNKLKDLKDAAKKAGVNIDWKHIIDDYGRFIQDYNQAFVDKIQELRYAVNETKTKREIGTFNNLQAELDYLKAKFEYDKFKLNHVHQELVDDYYQRKLELEDNMIQKWSAIYSAYNSLAAKRREILSHTRNGVLEEHYQEELNKIKKEIDNLTNTYFYDADTDHFTSKHSIDDPDNPLTGERKSIYSIEAATALKTYLAKRKELQDEYFIHNTKFGFDEELEKNLDIIANYETRDKNGRLQIPEAELMKHPDYVKAKEWISVNARYVVDEDTKKLINDAFKVLRNASKVKDSGEVKKKILSDIAKLRDAYDNFGVIDATKFTEKDIDNIRQDELVSYNIRENQPYSDRTLISNAPKNTDVFESSFYQGMKTDGVPNEEYIKLVNQINEILEPYYDTAKGILYTYEISKEDLQTLAELYDKIEGTKKTLNSSNKKQVRKYIQKNVDFIVNQEEYDSQKDYVVRNKDRRYLHLWQEVFERIEENEEGNDVVVPNRRVFGYAVPKGYKPDGTGDNSMVDPKMTEALQIIHNYTTIVKTQYYYDEYKRMKAKSKAEFDAWYKQNHIYNPYTRSYQPLQCWTRLEVTPMADEGDHVPAGIWTPAYSQTDIRPFDGKDKNGNPDGSKNVLNLKFKQNSSTAANYKKEGKSSHSNLYTDILKDDTDYSNHDIEVNEYERKIKDLFQDNLYKLAKTSSARRYLDGGFMVSRAKGQKVDKKFLLKEAGKFIGWIEGASGREAWYEDIDYANDKTPDMPMMSMLKSTESTEVSNKKPERLENESDEDYLNRLAEFDKNNKEAKEKNLNIHKELLDANWESVMEDFIVKAAHFNAIQDNKYMLFYGKNMLDKLEVYVKNLGFNDLQKDNLNSTDEENRYVTKKDTRLQDQYANWLRRLVYDQWKKPNNGLTRAANILQSMTSAKFMMLNITGGIANVTLGETQILGEVFAKEYFGSKSWAQGTKTYTIGIPSYFADLYKDNASSLESAIVKHFNIVDFDELTGRVHVDDPAEKAARVRDALYSPQAMGEHSMQNRALFSMLHSHRLYKNNNVAENGRTSYIARNEAEVIRDAHERALQDSLTPEQKLLWDKFIAIETKDANSKKEYAWFRKDFTTEFINIYINDAKQKADIIAKRKQYQKEALAEFNDDIAHPTLFSQLQLSKDGYLEFKNDSILSTLGDEAYKILGTFKGRVISVNKKIHGVYDRLGAAKWESYWWGGLVMQYHKHLYPGIMKRWRRQGYFNEERGTIEKGCYASLKDFLALPLHKAKYAKKLQAETGMTDSELQSALGIQNIMKDYVDFALHVSTHWNLLPESERANIRRTLGDLCGVLAGLCTAIALRCLADDEDEQGFVYNLFMYEADRLVSESAMYNPLGLYSEGKKLWSSPIAAQSGIAELLNTMGLISQWMLYGEEFDPTYQTGLYAGENKLTIKLKRNIPIYHSMYMLDRLERNNRYYKLGDNMLSIIPVKGIAEHINEAID